MKTKFIVIIVLEYLISVIVMLICSSKMNALWLFAIAIIQIVVSLFINRTVSKKDRMAVIISICLFIAYTIFQNHFYFVGERLITLSNNSSFISHGNIETQLTNPWQNTIVTSLICIILHWKLNGRKSE